MSDNVTTTQFLIAIAGDGGELDSAISALLPDAARFVESTPPTQHSIVVVAADRADSPLLTEVEGACRTSGVQCLATHVRGTRVQVGPLSSPGSPGCGRCATLRRESAVDPILPVPAIAAHRNGFAVQVAAAHVLREVDAIVRRAGTESRIRKAFLTVDLRDLTSRSHSFLPVPSCPVCGSGLPEDNPEAARLVLQSRPKPGRAFRVRALAPMGPALVNTYVDSEAGIIRDLRPGGLETLPTALAPMGITNGFGRATDLQTARLTAITEAMERFSGLQPGGRRTVVHSSRRALGDTAIDPFTLGLHLEECYADPEFPFRRYTEDSLCDWVWGHSFARDEPVLVPKSYVYYGGHNQHGKQEDRPFIFTSSNGTAMGGCAEEAILHGLLELAERDAFLMTWYARLHVPRIAPRSVPDPAVPLLIERVRQRTGYQVDVFATTMEHRVPSFWVMGRREGDNPRQMKTLSAAGSGLDATSALTGALHELTAMLDLQPSAYPHQYKRAGMLVADPSLVTSMDDHGLLYGHPAAFDRLEFLFDSAEQEFADVTCEWAWPQHDDLRTDCVELIRRYLATGLDVIAVDLTTPELATTGLASYKIVVPGLLPMTFGHRNRRVVGLPRLHTVPQLLGHRSTPLEATDVNANPHPFP
ncbi:TOMM precursor leader peptide-binding protein [Streptomyces sp. NPDC047028]|uniref:TOMM precursor leader peptide-binding protein n=1 Tax=Streptomyces sp. NPDC047028 TaxID=3155793 RepID=UPI0033DF5B49